MELTPLRYFRAIVTAGHMTRAARELGVTQPALSAVVKKLEAEVGAELLHRTGRGVEPTDAGRVLLAHAEDAIRAAESGVKAVRELLGLERGSIRVGGGATATAYILPPVVSTVRKKHPGLRFFVREAGSAQVAQAVASGELDLGIITLPVPKHMQADLAVVPLVQDELRLITPAGHPLRSRSGRGEKPETPRRAIDRRKLPASPLGADAVLPTRRPARPAPSRGLISRASRSWRSRPGRRSGRSSMTRPGRRA